jgi:hypothetical protein
MFESDANLFNYDAYEGSFSLDTHVKTGFDIHNLILGYGKNILLEGIRGTGKTHTLKAINSMCLETYLVSKVFPIYISISRLCLERNCIAELFNFFISLNIINSAIAAVEKNKFNIESRKESKISTFAIERLFGIEGDELYPMLKAIREVNEILLTYITTNPMVIVNWEERKFRREIGSSIKIGTRIKSTLGLERQHGLLESQFLERMTNITPYRFALDFFYVLKNILDCRYIFLLADDCNIGNRKKQLEIFKLLKLIRVGSIRSNIKGNYLYFAASFFPSFYTTFPSTIKNDPIDFIPGQDAGVEYLQLDELSEGYEKFFSELTRKRLEAFSGRKIENHISKLFYNRDVFLLASYCANGIPRRYLEILKLCSPNPDSEDLKVSHFNDINKISLDNVKEAISLLTDNQFYGLSSKDRQLLLRIIEKISKRNKFIRIRNKNSDKKIPETVYFSVERGEIEEFKGLLINGCLHDKQTSRFCARSTEAGHLLMLDLALAIKRKAIDSDRSTEIFKDDLRNDRLGETHVQPVHFELQ